jgi:hypothetical protein
MSESHGARRRRLIFAVAVVASAGAALAACGTSREITQMTCPQLIAAPGTDTITVLRPGGHAPQDAVVRGRIYQAHVQCARDKVGISAFVELTFYVVRTSPRTEKATLPYFVAVVDPAQKVVAQEGFRLQVEFLPGEPLRRAPVEKITVHLPVRSTAAANVYALVVGFQLTPDQLAYNRSIRAP